MKKKGFTLVELLAVIAILAILVIIALPNVMGMFNNAKKSSFETEIKEIIKGAQQQWMMDSVTSSATAKTEYASATLAGKDKKGNNKTNWDKFKYPTAKEIESVDVRTGLKYYLKLNGTGTIIVAAFSDGTYEWAKQDNNGIKGENVSGILTVAEQTGGTETTSSYWK